MSGRKILTLGLVVGIGVLNGYYVFEPTFREHAESRTPLDLKQQQQQDSQVNKAKSSNPAGTAPVGEGSGATKADR